jgi:hypothetical protein
LKLSRNRGGLGVLAGALLASLALAPGASAAVLYDQYNNIAPSNQAVSSNDAPPAAGDTKGADDFVVPAGSSWSLTGVDARGDDLNASAAFNVYVYADAGTLPGGLLAARESLPNNGALPDHSVTLSPPIDLQPGTYWLTVQSDTTNGWGWAGRTVQTGSAGAWMSDSALFPCQNAWGRKTDCLMAQAITAPDYVFRLNGTSQPIPMASTATQGKTCKRKKHRKHKAAAAKKKHKKKCGKKRKRH